MTATTICKEFKGENWGQPGLCLVFAYHRGEDQYSVEFPGSELQCDVRCLVDDQLQFFLRAPDIAWTGSERPRIRAPIDPEEISAETESSGCPWVSPSAGQVRIERI